MSKGEIQQYEKVNGKIVYRETLYRKITNSDLKHISKAEYKKLLIQYSKSKFPRKTSLERVYLKLINEGNRKIFLIAEQHFDYIPADLKPMNIEIQYRSDYNVTNQFAKQIWWTSSLFNSKNIHFGMERYQKPDLTPPYEDSNQLILFNAQGREGSKYYNVNWKQSSLFDDVVGLHFYNTAEFEVPKNYNFADIYIQGKNPHLSEQLSFDFSEGK
jgi:hypothetical protein